MVSTHLKNIIIFPGRDETTNQVSFSPFSAICFNRPLSIGCETTVDGRNPTLVDMENMWKQASIYKASESMYTYQHRWRPIFLHHPEKKRLTTGHKKTIFLFKKTSSKHPSGKSKSKMWKATMGEACPTVAVTAVFVAGWMDGCWRVKQTHMMSS